MKIIYILIISLFVYIFLKNRKELFADSINSDPKNETIYCLMITGKDNERYKFAKRAILNFNIQTYQNKKLIIINHGSYKLIKNSDNIQEYMIDKTNKTLGDLRNISLSFVPSGEIWTTWDDDDWRHPEYLSLLYKELKRSGLSMLMIKNRLEYNIQNKFCWQSSMKSGFYWYFCYKNNNQKYDSLDTFEDGIIKKTLLKNKIPYHIYNNDPKLYIRYVHNNNTSLFVNPHKYKINNYPKTNDFSEFSITEENKNYLLKIINLYYGWIK